MKKIHATIAALLSLFLVPLVPLSAQVPTHVPGSEGDPVVFNFINIIIFIVVPFALFVFYIWWERNRAKKHREDTTTGNNREGTENSNEEKGKVN